MNCKNCGAPLTRTDGKCDYCGSYNKIEITQTGGPRARSVLYADGIPIVTIYDTPEEGA